MPTASHDPLLDFLPPALRMQGDPDAADLVRMHRQAACVAVRDFILDHPQMDTSFQLSYDDAGGFIVAKPEALPQDALAHVNEFVAFLNDIGRDTQAKLTLMHIATMMNVFQWQRDRLDPSLAAEVQVTTPLDGKQFLALADQARLERMTPRNQTPRAGGRL